MTTVVFDLGGVVIRWDPVEALAAVLGRERAERFVHGDDFDFAAWNQLQDAGRPFAVAEAEAIATHPHLAEEIAAYRPRFARSLTGLVPGTDGILRALGDRGVRLVALTNWSGETIHHLPEKYPDTFALFSDVVVSGVERVAKPDARIFRLLEQRLAEPIAGMVFVDDSPANVEAARALGMDALLFTGAEALREELQARGLLGVPH